MGAGPRVGTGTHGSMRHALLSAVAVVLSAAAVQAWGNLGHEIICAIAWEETTPRGRALVAELLGPKEAFVAGCRWADAIRGDPRFHWVTPQHFVNIVPGGSFTAARDCPVAGCVVRAIGQQGRAVATAALDRSARAEALMLLGHFIGDIHQPLHVSHAGDRGGNGIAVEMCAATCRRTNLHAVWDADLVAAGGAGWRRRAAALHAAITPGERRRWGTLDVQRWTAESFALAETRAYPVAEAATGPGAGPLRLPASYLDRSHAIAQRQLKRASVRLAAALDMLAGGSVPPSWNAVPVVFARATQPALAVYRAPAASSAVIERLRSGARAEVIGTSGERVRIRLAGGREGYVARAHVALE